MEDHSFIPQSTIREKKVCHFEIETLDDQFFPLVLA
jgi:hypothetical protein